MIQENLVQTIESSIRRNWNYPAFSDFEKNPESFAVVGEKLLHWHQIFSYCNIKRGDKIAVIGKNSANWALVYLATVTYGAVVVPILPEFVAENVHHIVNHSDSTFLFASESNYEKLDPERMKNLEAVFSLRDFSILYCRNKNIPSKVEKAEQVFSENFKRPMLPEQIKLPEISNDELAAIVYTSGTTGFSKGVMLSHNALIANVRFALKNFELRAGDSMVSFLPLAHAYACAFEFLFPFAAGTHVTFIGKTPTPQILVAAFQEVKPKLILAVPLIIEKIYRNKLKPSLEKKSVKFMLKLPVAQDLVYNKVRKKLIETFGGSFLQIIVGGAALNKEVEEFFKKIKFPITVGYGMTECGPLISYSSWEMHRPLSVGKVVDTLEIKINSADPRNIPGEILVKGENVMNGYYKNEAATKDVIDKAGWLHTGDMGIIDSAGFIFIRGRCKNMILGPSGQNIYPEEIEAVINNMPYVMESLVLEHNGKIYALVYPDLEKAETEGIYEEGLKERMETNRKQLNQILPSYISVAEMRLYPNEFEKTPTKKIKRFLYTISAS